MKNTTVLPLKTGLQAGKKDKNKGRGWRKRGRDIGRDWRRWGRGWRRGWRDLED